MSLSTHRQPTLPSLKTALLVYGVIGVIVLGMFTVAYQREKATSPECTDVRVEIDLSTIAPESGLELSTPEGGFCVGDVIYEDPSLCSDGITIFGPVRDRSAQDAVQFRLSNCALSVESITR